MAKLSTMKPKLAGPSSRFASTPRDEAQRSRMRRQDPMFKLYGTAQWKKLRASVLVRDRYTCAKCGRLAVGKGQAVVDHVKPHATNLQVLCKSPCHDSAKQKDEQTAIKGVIVATLRCSGIWY